MVPQAGGMPRPMFGVGSWWTGLLLTAGFLLLAYIVGQVAPSKRHHIRRVVLPYLLWLSLVGLGAMFHLMGWMVWAEGCAVLALLMKYIAGINLAGVALFDLALPFLRFPVENIVADLALGFGYIAAAIVVLRQSGMNLSGIVATSAVVTGVLGLSLQATLGNILGGVALQLDDSIHVGDWIQLENGKQGKVTEIRWRHTVVETRDWDTLIVPNSSLLAQNIQLLGKRQDQPVQHRMWVYFNVDFRYAPSEVLAVVNAALQAAPLENVALDPPAHAICFDFAKDNRDSFAYYAIRYWLTDLAKDDPTSSLVRLRAFTALKRAGIPLAIPAAELFLSQDDAEHTQRKENRELERRIAALDNVDLFNPMTRDEKARIAARVKPAPFTKGEIITHQGAVAHWLYILTKGSVEIRLKAESGVEAVINTIQAPGFFGELGMMTGARRSSTVAAMNEVECLRLDKADFQQVISQRPQIAQGISKILAERQVGLQAGLEHLNEEEQRQRLDKKNSEILAEIRAFFGLEDGPG
ncbi:MAG TPA: mechanosensitive ion channel family protein [Holophagaceae bacterium]|nr:mechanosensitive ion channel family protein [Holophagaceae bacterium]